MTRALAPILAPILALLAAGCSLDPAYRRPASPAPLTFPQGSAYPALSPDAADPAALGWRTVFADPKLATVIERALVNNRDLRTAAANIEAARGQYQVQRSGLAPSLAVTGSQLRARTILPPTGIKVDERISSLSLGVSAYELDVFGRIRSLSGAALQRYLAAEESRRSVQISLIAETASDYLAVGADRALLAIARSTVVAAQDSLALTRRRFEAGTASELDVRQADTVAQQARADVARYVALAAQARNALELVVGAPVDDALLPVDLDSQTIPSVDIRPGLSSEVLLSRPDVQVAERQLRAANANIGAARAAFFPRITLTGSAGDSSTALSNLFSGGASVWSFTPTVTLPIFSGGQNLGNLHTAKAQRDAAVSQYEKAVQTAFREAADALAQRGGAEEQLAAQTALAEAAAASLRLSTARYERGADSYLNTLLAQRTLYSARQTRLGAQLARAQNLVTLYRTLGGGLTP